MTTEKGLALRPIVELTPSEVVDNATAQARLLMNIVDKTGCFQEISGKKYLQVEAWETIGAFNRTHAETDTVIPLIRDNETIGYQAHVQLWKDGAIVGGAVMPCYFTENCCKGKEGDAKHKACMSAAQTFATSKAYRMNFSYIAILAGYQPLPAEEVTEDMAQLTQVDKVEHWCKLHETKFFMRGKMTSYAHPIAGTNDWCHERTPKEPEQPPESAPASPEAPPEAIDKTQAKAFGDAQAKGDKAVSGTGVPMATKEQLAILKEMAGTTDSPGRNMLIAKLQKYKWPTVLTKLTEPQAAKLISDLKAP